MENEKNVKWLLDNGFVKKSEGEGESSSSYVKRMGGSIRIEFTGCGNALRARVYYDRREEFLRPAVILERERALHEDGRPDARILYNCVMAELALLKDALEAVTGNIFADDGK